MDETPVHLPALTYLEWVVLRHLSHDHRQDPSQPLRSFQIARDTGRVWFHVVARDSEVTAPARKAALQLVKKGYMQAPDAFRNLRPNAAGVAAAMGPAPSIQTPKLPALDENDIDLLRDLGRMHQLSPLSWHTPMGLGGHSGSDHSMRLAKLARHGYVGILKYKHGNPVEITGDETVPKPRLLKRPKGSKRYRITKAGMAFLAERYPMSFSDLH